MPRCRQSAYPSTPQTVDKVGAGEQLQHHFSIKAIFSFFSHQMSDMSVDFTSLCANILASFFRFMHANVSPAFISIWAFPLYWVYRNPCCSLAVPKSLSIVSFRNSYICLFPIVWRISSAFSMYSSHT